MDSSDKRLLMLEGFLKNILVTNQETIENLIKTFQGIREYKQYTDLEFENYLDVVTGLLVPKMMSVETNYRIFIDDVGKTLDFFNDDLEYMKICAEGDKNDIDIVDLLNDVLRNTEARKDKERSHNDYSEESWKRQDSWLASVKDAVDEYKYYESINQLGEEDHKYIKILKRTLLYNQVILDRLDKSSDVVDLHTFERMWGEDDKEDEDDRSY